MREPVDIIRESPMRQYLTIGEKIDALLYAVDSVDGLRTTRTVPVDVSDIIGELFAGHNS